MGNQEMKFQTMETQEMEIIQTLENQEMEIQTLQNQEVEIQTKENQLMEFQTMENNLFKDMPQAPTPSKLPKTMTEEEEIAYAIQLSMAETTGEGCEEPEPKKRRQTHKVAMTGAERKANCIQRKQEAEEQAIEQAILDDPATVTNRSELNGEEACPEMKRFHDIEWRHQYRARRGLLPLPRKL